jgi:hypothetical protein
MSFIVEKKVSLPKMDKKHYLTPKQHLTTNRSRGENDDKLAQINLTVFSNEAI